MQKCPICSARVAESSRYPRYLCGECSALAQSAEGRPLEFSNSQSTGGLAAQYRDTGETYFSHECLVRGVSCRVDEAYLGGVVIQASPPNNDAFIAGQQQYFAGAFDRFRDFGGPSVYFHQECLRARAEHGFLSPRHIETLYATLTAWGMHRMGDSDKTKTKLTSWDRFRNSLVTGAESVRALGTVTLLGSSERDYSDTVSALRPCYDALDLSQSNATIVVNSKALFHLLPDLVPPIDRQYTVRFFRHRPAEWRDSKGKFRIVTLPTDLEAQFNMFRDICVEVKRLVDRIDRELFGAELRDHEVTPPKAIDNAIVNYVRLLSEDPRPAAEGQQEQR